MYDDICYNDVVKKITKKKGKDKMSDIRVNDTGSRARAREYIASQIRAERLDSENVWREVANKFHLSDELSRTMTYLAYDKVFPWTPSLLEAREAASFALRKYGISCIIVSKDRFYRVVPAKMWMDFLDYKRVN